MRGACILCYSFKCLRPRFSLTLVRAFLTEFLERVELGCDGYGLALGVPV